MLKVGAKVKFAQGEGKIIAIHETQKGNFYEVKDSSGKTRKLRAAVLTKV